MGFPIQYLFNATRRPSSWLEQWEKSTSPSGWSTLTPTMFGLPDDLDLSFFVGISLIQLGMGEHQIIFVLHPDVRLSVGSRMRLTNPEGETFVIDEDYRET